MSQASLIDRIESIPRRELYFFALYRVLEAGLVAALVFGPLGELVGPPHDHEMGAAVAVTYLVAAALLLALGRDEERLVPLVAAGTCIDILAAILATHALPAVGAGIAMMLMFNVAAAAMLLPLRHGLGLALLAAAALVAEHVWALLEDGGRTRSLAELTMFVTSYLALAWLAHEIGRRARANQRLAEQRSAEVANLVEINEMIIRRMRTGVLVVDAETASPWPTRPRWHCWATPARPLRRAWPRWRRTWPRACSAGAPATSRPRTAPCACTRTSPRCSRASPACWPIPT